MAIEVLEAFLLPLPLLGHNLQVLLEAPELLLQGGAFYSVDVHLDPEHLPMERPPGVLASLDRKLFNGMLLSPCCASLRSWHPEGALQRCSLSPAPTILRHGWEMTLDAVYGIVGQTALLHQIEAKHRAAERSFFFVSVDAQLFTAGREWKSPEVGDRILGVLERAAAARPLDSPAGED